MHIGRGLLIGITMVGASLIAVELTASAVQMFAMQAENQRVAAWVAAERQVAALPPARAGAIVEASLH